MLSRKQNSIEKENCKINLDAYNRIIKRDIRKAKAKFYFIDFNEPKNSIKKTWDTIKFILNQQSDKSIFPNLFLINNIAVQKDNEIANYFNKYFTNIGPNLAAEINIHNKPPFQHYLRTPIMSKLQFAYTNENYMVNIINGLSSKTSSGHDFVSCKLLKEVRYIVASPISIAVNQTIHTEIFPDRLKIAKVIPLFKKGNNSNFDLYPCSLQFRKSSKIYFLTNSMIISIQITYFITTNNMVLEKCTQLNMPHWNL